MRKATDQRNRVEQRKQRGEAGVTPRPSVMRPLVALFYPAPLGAHHGSASDGAIHSTKTTRPLSFTSL